MTPANRVIGLKAIVLEQLNSDRIEIAGCLPSAALDTIQTKKSESLGQRWLVKGMTPANRVIGLKTMVSSDNAISDRIEISGMASFVR